MERHLLKACTRTQKIIARSSAEAELYGVALGASEVKGVDSMMSDVGFVVKPVLTTDAKATEHILHRHGIEKMKHINVAHLLQQDDVKGQFCGHWDEGAQQHNHQIRFHISGLSFVGFSKNWFVVRMRRELRHDFFCNCERRSQRERKAGPS